ncbi:MAG: NAD(P)/FAD-dependent oxidoreductase [Prevotellaceae bacterium]|jgi:NADH dehydrogenase|nr:NAD(P)/FAD-dependent oxidoreductase [Prevotellaceae bacterium]
MINLPETNKKRVLIIGGGFAGLKLMRELEHSDFQVTLIDKNNYHQFQPLIYQVASAGLEPSAIAFSFRKLLRGKHHMLFRMAELRGIYPEQNMIQTSIGKAHYDYLVLAAGTVTNFYGNRDVEATAIPMKNVSDAMGLRNALLSNFERAMTCATAEERRELLNIVIVGGGATGVEIAGALAEMKRFILPSDYPELRCNEMQIYLIEGQDRLLGGMDKRSSAEAERSLTRMGVKVILGEQVKDYSNHAVTLADGSTIPTQSFIWVCGVKATPTNLPANLIGRGGRIQVDAFNRVQGMDNIFCIGDQCLMSADPAYPGGHPQLAQVAIQQARQLAANLKQLSQGKEQAMKPFRYSNHGVMATIGRNRAVAEVGKFKWHGWAAWVTWLTVHLMFILGVRNKMLVFFNWLWNYLTYDRSIRLILYARKATVVREREEREAKVHLPDVAQA